ncbi:peptidoglycan-binding protein [Natronosporangium hydrolyticum]|uniref:Peptidoglycan-binding protein n=1 Tax=Natronosporangium hydrolyticum TaxID=2811111 RepID=A0A895YKR3_9ACTN|nr:peptidoglycan-binding domain-containing protein [Natronosporangium hydrolyticum]QSB15246.1 peptidoglycan-binding protein [Natronosporangium hydrolyticum]
MPTWLLGGIWAAKSGYHSSRAYNQANHPGNYSIRLSLDLQGPSDKAAAIDYTMSDAEMRRRTGYLRDGVERNDPRLYAVREFYGTVNSSTVFGRIKDSRTGSWRVSSADSSHLWHIHISFFRAYVNVWNELSPVLSVLSGESLSAWQDRQGSGGDDNAIVAPSGSPALQVTSPVTQEARVGQLQRALNELGENLTVDNRYTQAVADAVRRMQQAAGIPADGIYGTQSQQALATFLEEGMPITSSELQSIAEAVWYYRLPWTDAWVRDTWGLREDGWRALTIQQSSYGHSRRGSEESLRSVELSEAILAAVTGGGQQEILQRIDSHHETQMAAIAQAADEAVSGRVELLSLVQQAQAGEIAAEAVVDELARRLAVAPAPA